MSEIGKVQLQYGQDGLEAEFWLNQLTVTRAYGVGEALARHEQVGEAVLGALEAGANAEDVLTALVMTGEARRVTKMRDRLPFLGRLGLASSRVCIELAHEDHE